jgi:nucleoside-diphosphate-sugar epimerase
MQVARAIIAGLWTDATGPINLACEDSLSFEGMQKACHRITLGVPPRWAQAAARFAFNALRIGPDPAWAAGLDRPLILDSTRARTVLAWRPQFQTVRAILQDTYRPARGAGPQATPPNTAR